MTIQISSNDISYVRCKSCYNITMFHLSITTSKTYFICPICNATVNIANCEIQVNETKYL